MESSRQAEPTSANAMRDYLTQHASTIVTYLEQASESLDHQIINIFTDPLLGRLFFQNEKLNKVAPDVFAKMVGFLSNDILLQRFHKLLICWLPILTEEGIAKTRQRFFNDYFLPIVESPEYQTFLAKQLQGTTPEDFEKETSRLNMMIAGAMMFGIAGQWIAKNPGMLAEKLALLSKILNGTSDVIQLIDKFKLTLHGVISSKLIILLENLHKKEEKKEAKIAAMTQLLLSISGDFYFVGFKQKSHIDLSEALSNLFKAATEKDKAILAKAILNYCVANYDPGNKELLEQNKAIKDLIDLIKKYIEPSSMEKYEKTWMQLESVSNGDSGVRTISEPDLKKRKSSDHVELSIFSESTPMPTLERPKSRIVSPVDTSLAPIDTDDAPLAPRHRRGSGMMRRRMSLADVFTSIKLKPDATETEKKDTSFKKQ
jgi:hypothetical protein